MPHTSVTLSISRPNGDRKQTLRSWRFCRAKSMRRDEYDSGYGGTIRALRKSMPRQIPAPFRDFSVKTAIPFYLWPNARSVDMESDTEHQFSMRLTPAFGRPLPHTGDNSADPCYARSLRAEDRPCKTTLYFFEVAQARLRFLAAISQPDRSTTYRLSKSIRENVRKV